MVSQRFVSMYVRVNENQLQSVQQRFESCIVMSIKSKDRNNELKIEEDLKEQALKMHCSQTTTSNAKEVGECRLPHFRFKTIKQ